MIRILIADDHQITIDGIKSFLANEKDIQVVGEALHGEEVLQFLEKQPVDVIILDLQMPVMNGLEAAKIILRKYPKTKILLLTMQGDGQFILNALKLGIHGYVIKEKSKETLIGAIHAVYRGARYWSPELLGRIPAGFKEEEKEEVELTEREKQVLCTLAQNPAFRYKDIGIHLNIAEVTVQTHVRNIKSKLNLNKATELMQYAMKNKLCD